MSAGELYVPICIYGIVQYIVAEQCAGDGLAFYEILTFDDLHDLAGTVVELFCWDG